MIYWFVRLLLSHTNNRTQRSSLCQHINIECPVTNTQSHCDRNINMQLSPHTKTWSPYTEFLYANADIHTTHGLAPKTCVCFFLFLSVFLSVVLSRSYRPSSDLYLLSAVHSIEHD